MCSFYVFFSMSYFKMGSSVQIQYDCIFIVEWSLFLGDGHVEMPGPTMAVSLHAKNQPSSGVEWTLHFSFSA